MTNNNKINIHFSDCFNVDKKLIETYGAFNISLMSDLPLFIDPFLIFNSEKIEYQKLHKDILKYIVFLRDYSIDKKVEKIDMERLYCFKEVKQTWLGYSISSNKGRGLGKDFAIALNSNFRKILLDFDAIKITQSPHLEKLCLIKEHVGKDQISDFVTNLIKDYLLTYTQAFAKKNIDAKYLKEINVARVCFDYEVARWKNKNFLLPFYNSDFVLLTPKDILTKDDTWINKSDMINDFDNIVESIPNTHLRYEINTYFNSKLPRYETKKGSNKKYSNNDFTAAIDLTINEYPDFIDYYIRYKENNGNKARDISAHRVTMMDDLFVNKLDMLVNGLNSKTKFYQFGYNTVSECFTRTDFFKDYIENKDGYLCFYDNNDEPIRSEKLLQTIYRAVWFGTPSDISRESNEGRGPADYKISRGAFDKTIVEFKLASNSKLKQNLKNQVEVYKKAHNANESIKIILYFTIQEKEKVEKILKELKIYNDKYIVLIDARKKISASKVQ